MFNIGQPVFSSGDGFTRTTPGKPNSDALRRMTPDGALATHDADRRDRSLTRP